MKTIRSEKSQKRFGRRVMEGIKWRVDMVREKLGTRARYVRASVPSTMGRVYADQQRERAIFHIANGLERLHRTRPWSGRMLVVQAEGLYHEPAAGWRDVPGTLAEMVVVPGFHKDQRSAMAEPKVAVVAAAVRSALSSASLGAATPIS
jgi:hypothetical protein